MKIILLSGGSGKRLWPLSNDVRSKQFLRILPGPRDTRESMIQRVTRQISEAGLTDAVTIATGASQLDIIQNQLGSKVNVAIEPSRRDTFPAIALACAFLKEQGATDDEVVVVMPCDVYTDAGYFQTLRLMAQAVEQGDAELVLMGVKPTSPSSKFGYIMPAKSEGSGVSCPVASFKEKPSEGLAQELINSGAVWNGGVFAFRLGYLIDKTLPYFSDLSYEHMRERYDAFPKISFDYEVVERAKSIAMVTFSGLWRDLGTWDALCSELPYATDGNVSATGDCSGSTIINELEMPLVCMGMRDTIVAASPDGIIVANKEDSQHIKAVVDKIAHRPLYEERRWGWYKVISQSTYLDGGKALTKVLHMRAGSSISYQSHSNRTEVWTITDGEGIVVIDGVEMPVKRGFFINISVGQKHAIRAITELEILEVQLGSLLEEEDIERFPYEWEKQ